MKISSVHARQILDSRGFPTIETDVVLDNGSVGTAAIPSGASTGTHEALELRDNDPTQYNGKSVHVAIDHVCSIIGPELVGKNLANQKELDERIIQLDGTDNKSHLGANAILSVSLAAAKAEALSKKIPFYQHIGEIAGNTTFSLPLPMMNIINGGKHAAGSTDIQEFMILPLGAGNFSQALEMGSNVFHVLGKILSEKNYATTVGDEGGYAPHVKDGNKEALDLISHAIQKAGYDLGHDIVLGLDVASSELKEQGNYMLKTEHRSLDTDSFIGWLIELTKDYPLASIEDGLAEDDFDGWKKLTSLIGDQIQLVGDDLFVTDPKRIEKGIAEKEANAVLIKLNQIGTLTETINAVKTAQHAGWKAIISHRSGETEDTTIADLAVGLNAGQIKTGSLSRSERIAKYNRLLRIEEELADKAVFAGKNAILR